jgi:hypothetical protein
MRVTVITAIYDDYDDLKPILPQEGVDVDWVCVTDKPREDDHGWRIVVEPRPGQHPNVAAKRPKMLPWEYTDAFWSIWIDASFLVRSPHLAKEVIEFARPIAQFRHPSRDCVYTEADVSIGMAKYASQPIAAQMQACRATGHPMHWGLWATGVIARQHCPAVRELGQSWLRTCQEWSFQDQLSQATHLRTLGLLPDTLPGSPWNNDWMEFRGSDRH